MASVVNRRSLEPIAQAQPAELPCGCTQADLRVIGANSAQPATASVTPILSRASNIWQGQADNAAFSGLCRAFHEFRIEQRLGKESPGNLERTDRQNRRRRVNQWAAKDSGPSVVTNCTASVFR